MQATSWRQASAAALCIAVGTLPVTALAAEAYAIWDTFTGATEITPLRWQGTERSRSIQGSALVLRQRDLGSQAGDTGVVNTTWATGTANPNAITQMRVSVTVNEYDIVACATNPAPTEALGRISGSFFNVGPAAPAAGNRTGDVGALMRMARRSNSSDAANVLKVEGVVFQCTNIDCSTSSSLGLVEFGTATVGETVSLKMEWEQSFNRFNFYRGTDPVQRVTYSVADSLLPGIAFKELQTRTVLPNCLNSPRAESYVEAKFDNFSVNASAAP